MRHAPHSITIALAVEALVIIWIAMLGAIAVTWPAILGGMGL